MTTLTLPYPPSVNSLFVNAGKRGRVRTKAYDAWILAAGLSLNLQRPAPVTGPFKLTIGLDRPDRRARDCTNLIKALEDLLVKHGVTGDDSLADDVRVYWRGPEVRKPALAHVSVEAVAA